MFTNVRVFCAWSRLKSRRLDPNKTNVMFAQLLGTRDFISYALGQFLSVTVSVAILVLRIVEI